MNIKDKVMVISDFEWAGAPVKASRKHHYCGLTGVVTKIDGNNVTVKFTDPRAHGNWELKRKASCEVEFPSNELKVRS